MMDVATMLEKYEILQNYIGWQAEDVERIRMAAAVLQPHLGPLIDDFYATIEKHPAALQVITGGAAQIERLKQTLFRWLGDLLTGPYDQAYVVRRWKVGFRHVEIGLDQLYADAALARMRCRLVDQLETHWPDGMDSLRATLVSLNKLLDLELTIITSAYQAEFLAKLQRSERFAALGQVTGGISHELRNPLNVIKTSTYYLLNARSLTPEKSSEHLKRIEKQVQIADNVISALSSFAKQKQSSSQEFSALECVQKAIEDLLLPSSIQIDVRLVNEVGQVVGDEDQIRIVFANLLRNANDAMPKGGKINIEIAQIEDEIQITISDTGPGIPEELRHQVMEPFFTTKARGIGLGLSISRSIMERNLGTISVDGSESGGAAFRLRLPVKSDASDDEAAR